MVGTSLLRLLMRLRLGQPITDGTSGLYAVDRSALELLADDYICEAPEVEALVRITDAKLRAGRGPGAHARARARRVDVQGRRAVELVVTIGMALFAAKLLRRRHGHQQDRALARAMKPLRRRSDRGEAVVGSTVAAS